MSLLLVWEEKKSETQITGHSAVSSHKMQNQMAAEAGNKTTTAQRHNSNASFHFQKSKLDSLGGSLSGQRDTWGHLDPTPKT